MIHNSSIIDKKAKIGKNVKVGPFCYIGPKVQIGDNIELSSNVHIEGSTKVGQRTKIFPFASIGTQPQDLKYKGEKTSGFTRITPIKYRDGDNAKLVLLELV